MSDMQEWPDLSDCACGGRPIRNSAALGPELHYITCTVYRRTEHSGEGCARRAIGLSRAEAAAGWNGLQAEAWQAITSATLEIPKQHPEYARGHHDGYAQGFQHARMGLGGTDGSMDGGDQS